MVLEPNDADATDEIHGRVMELRHMRRLIENGATTARVRASGGTMTEDQCDVCGCLLTADYGDHVGYEQLSNDDACIAHLKTQLADIRVLELHMVRWIASHPSGMRDHACSRCVPGGPLVQAGFVCAPHVAEGLLAARESAKT
jgi:hypothetical protein